MQVIWLSQTTTTSRATLQAMQSSAINKPCVTSHNNKWTCKSAFQIVVQCKLIAVCGRIGVASYQRVWQAQVCWFNLTQVTTKRQLFYETVKSDGDLMNCRLLNRLLLLSPQHLCKSSKATICPQIAHIVVWHSY